LYLGVTSLWQAFFSKNSNALVSRGKTKTVTTHYRKLFLEGFITNLLNPKVSMFYLAAFPQFISLNDSPIVDSFILVGIHSIVVVFWFSIIIFLLGKAVNAVTSLMFKKLVQGATGVLMLWFGYRLLIYHQKS
jgi:threonine/homoserine/homoserine lactone efflux protein